MERINILGVLRLRPHSPPRRIARMSLRMTGANVLRVDKMHDGLGTILQTAINGLACRYNSGHSAFSIYSWREQVEILLQLRAYSSFLRRGLCAAQFSATGPISATAYR